jgi:hypothetical protein
VARMHRVLTAALIVSGFHAADGTVVPPSIGPNGQADARSRPITLEHTNMKRLIYSLAFVVASPRRHARLRPAVGRLARRVPGTWGP